MKKLLYIALLMVSAGTKLAAQCLFKAPDTVCIGQDVILTNFEGGPCGDSGVLTHQWIYESAIIQGMPAGSYVNGINGGLFIASVRDNNKYYTFVTNHTENDDAFLYRQSYGLTVTNPNPTEDAIPIPIADDSSYLLEGVDLVKSDVWYAFIVACQTSWFEDQTAPFSNDIIRVRFVNGIEDPAPVVTPLEIPDSLLKFPHEIQLVEDLGHWYGIVGNESDSSILILDFTDGLNGAPNTIHTTRYGYKDPAYVGGAQGISGLSAIKENGTWRVLASTHKTPSALIRFDFEDGLGAKPKYQILGNPNNSMGHTEDVAFVRDCNYQMAVSVSDYNTWNGDNQPSITLFKFDSTVNGTLTGEKYLNPLSFSDPHAISDIYNEKGFAYAFVCNSSKVSIIKFSPPAIPHTVPAAPVDTLFDPVVFSYKDSGRYNITLVVDNDISRTTCRTVFAMRPPAKPITVDPSWLCQGQKLTAITAPGVNPLRSRYVWTYPDMSQHYGMSPVVGTTGTYTVMNAYGDCVGDTIKRKIQVSDRPAPPTLNDIRSCPERHGLTNLTAGKLKARDSMFWYKDPDIDSLVMKDTVPKGKTYMTYAPDDSVTGIFDYYVQRKPLNSGCPRELSDSVRVLLILSRPTAPKILKDSSFCFAGASGIEPLYCPGNNVRWYNSTKLDSVLADSFQYKPVFNRIGITKVYTFYATNDSAGCRSNPGSVKLTVKDTPWPTLVEEPIIRCEGSTIPKFQAVPDAGGVINYYDFADSLLDLSIYTGTTWPTGAWPTKYTTKGQYYWWITQTANGCESVGKKILLQIDRAEPPVPVMPNASFYSCVGENPVLRVIPDTNAVLIRWFQGLAKLSETPDPEYTAMIGDKTGTFNFTVQQQVGNCWSVKVPIPVVVLGCTDTTVNRCSTDDSLNLFTIHDTVRTFKWQDNDYTGALHDSIVDLTDANVYGKHPFQYYNRLVYVNSTKQLYSGLPKDTTLTACMNIIPLDSILRNRDLGGRWFNGATEFNKPSAVVLTGGTNLISYKIPVRGSCVADESRIRVLADSTTPMISCKPPVFHSLEVNEPGYMAVEGELDPTVTDDDCLIYSLTNSFDQKSSLDSSYFSLDEKAVNSYTVIWIVTDPFGRSDTCQTELSMATFKIPNVFTPNDDGINDEWMFTLDKSPNAVVKVYNRWGEAVFESAKGYPEKWRGKYKNTDRTVPVDGYTYVIIEDNKIIFKGSVTVAH